MFKRQFLVLSTASLVGAGLVLVAAPSASAAPAGVEKSKDGRCSLTSHYEFDLEKEHGRIEVDFEVESNRAGEAWNVRMRHNGPLVVKNQTYVTHRDGDFTVERNLKNLKGKDTISVSATNAKTGEVCKATLSI